MEFVLGIWGAWTAGGIATEWLHQRRVQTVPHRFLVNGFRGKSTLLRLLHGALCDTGVTALGRATGDAPVLLNPDRSERIQHRIGPANIRELRRVVRHAAELRCQAVAIENMAVQPELVRLVAEKIVRPTVCLFGWDAPDHLEHYPAEAAPRARAVAQTLSPAVPVVLPNDERNAALLAALRHLGRPVHPVNGSGRADMMASVVERALELSGLQVADASRLRARAEELCRLRVYTNAGRHFVDLLSANDPESTAALMAEAAARMPGARTALVYFHRSDRPQRLISFTPLLLSTPSYLAGDSIPAGLRRKAFAGRIDTPDQLHSIEADLVFLVGNAKGTGEDTRRHLESTGGIEKW